jgi:hypothetical protein
MPSETPTVTLTREPLTVEQLIEMAELTPLVLKKLVTQLLCQNKGQGPNTKHSNEVTSALRLHLGKQMPMQTRVLCIMVRDSLKGRPAEKRDLLKKAHRKLSNIAA